MLCFIVFFCDAMIMLFMSKKSFILHPLASGFLAQRFFPQVPLCHLTSLAWFGRDESSQTIRLCPTYSNVQKTGNFISLSKLPIIRWSWAVKCMIKKLLPKMALPRCKKTAHPPWSKRNWLEPFLVLMELIDRNFECRMKRLWVTHSYSHGTSFCFWLLCSPCL